MQVEPSVGTAAKARQDSRKCGGSGSDGGLSESSPPDDVEVWSAPPWVERP